MRDSQVQTDADVAPQDTVADTDTDAMSADGATDRSLGLLKRDQQVSTEAKKIRADHDQAVLNHQILATGERDLDKDIEKARAAGDDAKVERLTDQKTKYETWQAALDKTISSTHADLELIDNPGTSRAALNQMLARRNAAGTSAATTQTLVDDEEYQRAIGRGDPRLPKVGFLDKVPLLNKAFDGKTRIPTSSNETETTETSSTVNNAAVTRTGTKSSTLDIHGVGWGDRKTTRVDAGADSASASASTQNQLGPTGFTRTTENKESETTGDVTASSGTKTTTSVGLGGGSRSTEKTDTVDDYQIKDTKTRSVTRGDGKIGAGSTSSSSVGTVDKDTGDLVKGNKNTTSGEGHLQADKEGVGLGGSGSAARENVHAKDVKTGVSVTGDGHVTISVKPYEGEDKAMEGRFVVVVSVHLGAGIGGSADAAKKWTEKEASQEGSIGGGVDASAKAAADLTFQHVMSADECKQYLDQLGVVNAANAGNGKYPELAQISAAWRDGWRGGAGAAVNAMRAAALDNPDAVRKMADGDKLEFSVSGSADAKAHVEGDVGGLDLGVHGGVGRGGTIKFTLAKAHDELLVTGAIDSDTDWSAGGSAGIGGVKGTYDHAEKKTEGTSVTFHLNPDEMAIKSEILAARSRADLDALGKKYPKLLKEHEQSSADTTSDTLGLELGKGKVELGNTAKVAQKITTDADGKQTEVDSGSAKHGGTIGYGDFKIGDSASDAVETKVGPDNKASGDLAHTDSATDLKKSLLDWDDRKKQSGAVGTATGSTGFKAEDSSDQSGMLLADADYDTIIATAQDPATWDRHAVSNRNRDDWRALRGKINAAHGDKKQVGAALAKFVGADDHDRNELVEAVVRKPLGSGEGGAMYDFPDGLGNLKSQYKSLVFEDPSTKAAQLAAAGKDVDAATEARAKISALDSLYNQLSSAQAKFQETGKIGAYGEMLHHITQRKEELAKYIKASDAEKARTRYNDLLTDCQKFQEQEKAAYAKIVDMDGGDAIGKANVENELRALYLKWDPEYAELAELGSAWLFDEKIWSKLKPDKYRWQQSHDQNVNPVGKSLDEQLADQTSDDRAAQMTEHLRHTTGLAEIRAAQQKQTTERDAAAFAQKHAVAEAKTKAAVAAAWHNRAMKDHQSIAPAAQQKAGAGWTAWAKATEQESKFNYVAGHPDAVAAAVDYAAQKAIDLFDEAEKLFKAGQALNHDA